MLLHTDKNFFEHACAEIGSDWNISLGWERETIDYNVPTFLLQVLLGQNEVR